VVCACESEDLPVVPGAPRPAAHRLAEWADGRAGPRPNEPARLTFEGDGHRLTHKGRLVKPQPATASSFTSTVLGFPRIGPHRELKRAIEGYWAGRVSRAELVSVASGLRTDALSAMASSGLDSIPVNTFSYYDQMLDTAAMLGALPPQVRDIDDDLDRYFAAARGTDQFAPLELT
jgi:5-methyltetrahydropteroyltriglutamate--homocysteine methyltransferase